MSEAQPKLRIPKTSCPNWFDDPAGNDKIILDGLWAVRNGLKTMEGTVTQSAIVQSFRAPATMIWTFREYTKYGDKRLRSKAAKGLPREELDLDHIIPFGVAAKAIFCVDCDRERFEVIMRDWLTTCLITKEEHQRLATMGYRQRMPEGWDKSDLLWRYKEARIELEGTTDGPI